MAALNPGFPKSLTLEVVTPTGLLMRDSVDEVICPGEAGSFGVLPGHTPFLSTLGIGLLSYRQGTAWTKLSCFWGFVEVLPDRVNVLAEVGERAEDVARSPEEAQRRVEERLKMIKGEAGYDQAKKDYAAALSKLT